MDCQDWLKESLWLNASHLDPGMLRTIWDQQNPKSLHQEYVDINNRSQLQANCASHHQVQDLPRRCSVPTGVLHKPKPLIQIINKTGYGYQLQNGRIISNLLYMDAIKLCAMSEWHIDSVIHTTRIYSNDTVMSFGLEKISQMVTKRESSQKWGDCTARRQHYRHWGKLPRTLDSHRKTMERSHVCM